MMTKIPARRLVMALVLGLLLPGMPRADETRDTMDLVYAAISELLPVALDEYSLEDDASRQRAVLFGGRDTLG